MTSDTHLPVSTADLVRLRYPLAGLGNRFLAAIVDVVILAVSVVGLQLLVVLLLPRDSGVLWSILAGLAVVLIFLVLPFAYFALLETFWNGQTVGKRVVGIRVIREDGAPVGFFPVVARALTRFIDVLPPALALDVVVLVVSRKGQRLGDLLAGTVVVKATFERDFRRLHTRAGDDLPRVTVRALSGEAQRVVREFALREQTLTPAVRAAVARSIAESIRPLVPETAEHPDDVAFLRAVAASLRAQAEEASPRV